MLKTLSDLASEVLLFFSPGRVLLIYDIVHYIEMHLSSRYCVIVATILL